MNSANPFGLKPVELSQIIDTLIQWPQIKTATLFGSRAMGTFREGSDIDIALDAPDMTHDDYLRLCTRLDDLLLPQKIDLVLLHEIDNNSLLDHIHRVGHQIYRATAAL
jgi:predicted nucleotidyltransferase